MKKMLLATVACLLQDVLNRRLLFKTNPAAVTRELHHHHFFVSGIGQKKTVMQPKFGSAKMLLKQKTQQTFVNGLLGFNTLGVYTPLEARVYYT